MGLADLADLAKLTISEPQEPFPTDGLWTSRIPVLLPPSPIPGQRNSNVPVSTHPSFPNLSYRSEFGLCANQNGDVYFHGGVTSSPKDDSLYHYSVTDNTITPLQCWGASPCSRIEHAMALVGNVIVIHGGHGFEHYDPGLYLLDLVSRQWSRIVTSGDAPGQLVRHSMAAVGTTVYIFGGLQTLGYVPCDKLWAFNLDTLRKDESVWELVEPSSRVRPAARTESTLVSYYDHLILYGGLGEVGDLGDVWSFNTKSRRWSNLWSTGDISPPRCGHTAAMLDDVMYIIGGLQGATVLRDVFALKISSRRWFKLKNTDTTAFPRYGGASVCVGTNIFTFWIKSGDPIHILDARHIGNDDLHTPKRLEELDVKFQDALTRKKLEARVKELEHENGRLRRSRIISYLLESPSKMDSLTHLQRIDTQMMVDFLADELQHQDVLQSNADRRHILHCLSKLAKSAQVFPKRTELSNVQCGLTNPVNDEGGYGFIYKGVFRSRAVCVKVVRVVGYDNGPGKMLRAQVGEVVLLAHISHPNVIPLYGAYLSNEEIPRICIVSPWMENGDLVAYLKKFPDTPKIPLMLDIATGLNFLHDMGIIHADLKARNVLVSQSQRAMLADFGVATILHTDVGTTTAGDFAGTAYWMAPELLITDGHHPPSPTKQSDMWGFACICYEMSTGEIPFMRQYRPLQLVMALVKGHRITPLRPEKDGRPVGLDGEPWVTLAERCWNYDLNERPTAAEAVKFFTELNVQDSRPSMVEELAAFEAIKGDRVKIKIDYTRILSIVQNSAVETRS